MFAWAQRRVAGSFDLQLAGATAQPAMQQQPVIYLQSANSVDMRQSLAAHSRWGPIAAIAAPQQSACSEALRPSSMDRSGAACSWRWLFCHPLSQQHRVQCWQLCQASNWTLLSTAAGQSSTFAAWGLTWSTASVHRAEDTSVLAAAASTAGTWHLQQQQQQQRTGVATPLWEQVQRIEGQPLCWQQLCLRAGW